MIVFWPTLISAGCRGAASPLSLLAGDADRDRLAVQAALPQLDEHAAPLGLLHLGIGLQIDGQIDRFGRADADGVDRHAQPGRGRLLARAQRGDARVVGEIAEQHDAGQPARAELLADLVDDRAEGRHLARGRKLLGQMRRIELRRRPLGLSVQLAKLAGGVAVER